MQINDLLTQGSVLYIPVSGIGDGIIFTVAAKYLFKQTGKKVLLSHKSNELFENNPYIETIDNYDDSVFNKDIFDEFQQKGINIVYPSYWEFRQDAPKRWIFYYPNMHIAAKTAASAGVNGKIKIEPKIYLTDDEKTFGRFSQGDKKQIVIMSTAVDLHKQWDKWQELVDRLKDQYCFVQLGAKKDFPLNHVLDLRGKMSLRQCASILYNSDLFVGQIGGLMHMARAVGTRSVIAYSSGEPIQLASYPCNINILPEEPCYEYAEKKITPWAYSCKKNYQCVRSISLEKMLHAIEKQINNKAPLETDEVEVQSALEYGLVNYQKRRDSFLWTDTVLNKVLTRIKRFLFR